MISMKAQFGMEDLLYLIFDYMEFADGEEEELTLEELETVQAAGKSDYKLFLEYVREKSNREVRHENSQR